MDLTQPDDVQSTLAAYNALSSEERRRFHHELLNPSRQSEGGNGSNGHPSEAEPDAIIEDTWQAFTLADAYLERPPLEYIAAGLFALPSLNIVYGAPGTLKSFLLSDLAVCAAAGNEWLSPAAWVNGNLAQPVPTRKCPVMWLDFDNGSRRTLDRFGALGRSRLLPGDTNLTFYSMPSPWLDAGNKKSIDSLLARMLSRGIKFLIVDNLGVVSGNADENSGDMVAVMSEFRQLAELTGAAIVLIHHQRKGTGSIGRAGDSLRGHSSIEAALDLALLVEREDLADTVSIKATKVRGADVLPFSAVFTYTNRPDGELHTARFFGIASDDNRSGAAIEREILASLRSSTLNKTELVKSVKDSLPEVGINRIRDMIDRLASTGQLSISNGKNNTEKLYRRV